jgi:ABC-type enterochelin transport system permease subunit
MRITNGVAKELRHYIGAIGIFVFVIGILVFLSFHQIPNMNKDVVVSIIGMIVGSLSVVIMTVIGRNPDEVNELKKQNEGLNSKVEHLVAQKDELERMLITIQTNIIDQLTLLGANAFDTIYSKKEPTCTCGENNCKCKGK